MYIYIYKYIYMCVCVCVCVCVADKGKEMTAVIRVSVGQSEGFLCCDLQSLGWETKLVACNTRP